MKIIKPKKLNREDTVGIISPSEPITDDLKEQFNKGLLALEKLGLKVKLGKYVFDQYYYNAGTREHRIKDFNDIWNDSKVKMILMSQGGETANHLLDGIDYEMIRNNPKIFSGISDGTTLLNAVFAKTGLVTYHGPDLVWAFGRNITQPFKENFIKTWFDGNVKEIVSNQNWKHQEKHEIKYNGWKNLRSGEASGIIVGGHSNCLNSTILAGYAPDFKNKILFLEGTDNEADLDMQFTALKLNGVFKKINGLILGWFDNMDQIKDKTKKRKVSDIILELTKEYNFPILEIGEIGHNVENYIMPIGCNVTINATKKTILINENTVI